MPPSGRWPGSSSLKKKPMSIFEELRGVGGSEAHGVRLDLQSKLHCTAHPSTQTPS